MSLLLDSRLGCRGGLLPWALLIIGAAASLAANITVAEPTVAGRVIAAWPSFALTASYELLMRQVRRAAHPAPGAQLAAEVGPPPGQEDAMADPVQPLAPMTAGREPGPRAGAGRGCCSAARGSGRWPTAARTGHCLPGLRWGGGSGAASGGAASSPG